MLNLFSIFDSFYFNYMNLFLIFLLLNYINFWKFSKKNFLLNFISVFLFKFFDKLNLNKNSKNILYYNMNLFFLIMTFNLMGIFPFYFSFTSQMSVVMIFSIFSWLSIFMFSLSKNFKNFMVHLIPEGCPMILVPFLFLIELISNLIRPMTLTLRLVGNMVSGHIFLSIIFTSIKNFLSLNWFMFMAYYSVEMVICMLQAYILITLCSMYYSEI